MNKKHYLILGAIALVGGFFVYKKIKQNKNVVDSNKDVTNKNVLNTETKTVVNHLPEVIPVIPVIPTTPTTPIVTEPKPVVCKYANMFVKNTADGNVYYVSNDCSIVPWRRITANGTLAGAEANKNLVDQSFILGNKMISPSTSVQDIIVAFRIKYNQAI